MTYRIGGQVVDQGTGVSGQPVFVVDTGDADPSNWTVEAATTTNADGSWSVVVSSGDLERYHAVTQFEDASALKNAESKPFVTGQPVVRPVEIPIQFEIPSPAIGVGITIPDTSALGFETMDGWTVSGGGQTSSRAFAGTYSFYSSNAIGSELASFTVNAFQPSKLTWHYYETSDSRGSGIRLKNSNGNYEVGCGTDNPSYFTDVDGTSFNSFGNGDYDVWTMFEITFDWTNGNITIDASDENGNSASSGTVAMPNGVDIQTIELWGYNNGGGEWGYDLNIDHWWDEFIFE